jgi:hypothetical protein
MGGLGMAVGEGFDKRRRDRRVVRGHSNQPAVAGQGRDNENSVGKKSGREKKGNRWKATRAGGEQVVGWVGWRQENPLRDDLWEGANLGERELPWTRKERRGKKGKERKRERERMRIERDKTSY